MQLVGKKYLLSDAAKLIYYILTGEVSSIFLTYYGDTSGTYVFGGKA